MKIYRQILSLARRHQKYIFWSLFFNILYSLFQILSLGTILPVLGILFGTMDEVEAGDNDLMSRAKSYIYEIVNSSIAEHGALTVLLWLCGITAIAFMLRNIFRYLGAYLLTYYRVGTTKDLRSAMYRKILQLPVSFFSEQRKGDLMSRMSNDVAEVENNILGSLVSLINSPFMVISTLITLFLLNAQLTLFSLIVLPVMGSLIALVGKSLKKDSYAAQTELGKVFSIVDETLKSSKIIKIFNADKLLDNRFTKSMTKWVDHSVSVGRKRELASPMSEFLGSITFLIITWYGGREILVNHSMQPQDFIVFLGMFFQILPPVKSLATAVSNVQKGEPAMIRVLEILEADLQVGEIENPLPIDDLYKDIEFKNVNFQYGDEHLVLKNFNLKIEKGQTVALVGQSGSGKTTVANLLARFYDVSGGQLKIDGKNIKELNLKQYRAILGMVTQESVLFNDTIYNNIAMGKENATSEEIIAAAKIANAHQFIENFPEGYQTNIGDDGNKLSGGQKQRISIARAVLKNPSIMILDEATSALDTESERYVQDALDKMMENRTSLVIAHRLSTIQKADWIVVMERGEIVEEGTHHMLMEKNGVYHKLVELQDFD